MAASCALLRVAGGPEVFRATSETAPELTTPEKGMASDASSARKRKSFSITFSVEDAYKRISCTLCSLPFDDAERTPRALICGHHFCTACLGARIRQESARKWCVACPLDEEETPVKKGDATNMGKCCAVLSDLALMRAAGPLPYRVHVKNMAGDVVTLVVAADDTIGDLKRRLHEANTIYAVKLQRLMLHGADDESTVLEDDAATLGALGIVGGRVVSVMMRDGYRGGEHMRTFGSEGSGAGQFGRPWGMCMSSDGELLFVADVGNHRVHVLRSSDGSHVRSIGSVAEYQYPSFVCPSHDGFLLFVADSGNSRVQVLRTSNGAHVRTIGSPGLDVCQFSRPRGLCLSLDGELLFVADQDKRHVQVLRASDGAHMRTIGSRGARPGELKCPHGLCLSPAGELLFVADPVNHRVQVFRQADGAHVRSIGSKGCGAGQFDSPDDVCVSPSGEWLFVADTDNHRVQVLRASDGEHAHTIGPQISDTERLQLPCGICLSPSGDRLFVSDLHRVLVFTA